MNLKGFDGLFKINHFVFSVINEFKLSASILKSFFMSQFKNLGLPPANNVISGYETQYGVGIITSSFGFKVANNALNKICLPPTPTITS